MATTEAILRHRRDTAANWTSANPVLEAGQLAFETDTRKAKLGDGSTAWASLNYISGSAVTSIVGITGTKAEFNTAVTDGNFLYVGDVTTNATHTGDVTGATALTLDPTAITGKTAVTAVGTDYILISDTSDSGNLKKALASDLTGGGGISDGDKGDITVSGSGTTWTIDAGVVTLAKQADMATASVVYRKTAGTGAPEVNTLATLKTDLGLTGTNSGDQTITLTGHVTGSGTGSFATALGSFTKAQLDTAVSDGNVLYVGDVVGVTDGDKGDITVSATGATWTIDAGTVTLAKMANLAANSIIGNNTGAGATPIALTATQVKTLLAIANTDVSGLGTAATQNTGTSGATIPLLNAVNTFVDGQIFQTSLDAGDGTTSARLYLNGAAATVRAVVCQTNGVDRWEIATSAGAETGSNAGSNFRIRPADDAGSYLGVSVSIDRSTGEVSFPLLPLGIASGGTGATTAAAARTALGAIGIGLAIALPSSIY